MTRWSPVFFLSSWHVHDSWISYIPIEFVTCTWLIDLMVPSWLTHDSLISYIYCRRWDSWLDIQHMCDMTHSCVWRDSFICVTWLIHVCDVTHLYVWHDSFICVTWLISLDIQRVMCKSRSMSHVHVTNSTTTIYVCKSKIPWGNQMTRWSHTDDSLISYIYCRHWVRNMYMTHWSDRFLIGFLIYTWLVDLLHILSSLS